MRWFAYAVAPSSKGASNAPATGSIKRYREAYKTAASVPRFGGRLGTKSHSGIGSSDGVFVPYEGRSENRP